MDQAPAPPRATINQKPEATIIAIANRLFSTVIALEKPPDGVTHARRAPVIAVMKPTAMPSKCRVVEGDMMRQRGRNRVVPEVKN